MLKGFDYLSDARVAMYNKHKEDLRLLKKVYKRDLGQEAYDRMFRSSEKGSYSAYCNSLNSTDSLAAEQKYRKKHEKRERNVEREICMTESRKI